MMEKSMPTTISGWAKTGRERFKRCWIDFPSSRACISSFCQESYVQKSSCRNEKTADTLLLTAIETGAGSSSGREEKGSCFLQGGRKESRSVLLCRERPGAQWLRSLSDKEQAVPVCRRAAGFPVQEPKKRCLVYKREMRGRASSYHPPCACHIVKIHKNLLRNE